MNYSPRGNWIAVLAGVALIAAGRAQLIVSAGIVDVELSLFGVFVTWLGSVVVLAALLSMPDADTLMFLPESESAGERRARALTGARAWSKDTVAALLAAVGAVIGWCGAVFVTFLALGFGDVWGSTFLAGIIGLVVSPIFMPPFLIGLALTPAVEHRRRDRRFRWALFGCGLVVGVGVALILMFGGQLLMPLADRAPWLVAEVCFFVAPACATVIFVRVLLALGVLRRVEVVAEE